MNKEAQQPESRIFQGYWERWSNVKKKRKKKQEALSFEYRLELLFQGQQVDMKGLELINVNYLYFRVVALGSLETSRMEVGR